jgi:pimeloyl-ACP methyl ester carboxylesterase
MERNTTYAEHTLDLQGMALHYGAWGHFTHPQRAVLLVHGLTANHRGWAALGPALAARGWYAVAPDLRGRGLSAKPPHGYGITFHADDLLTLCDALSLPAAHIVGHSLGAVVGLYLAALHPRRVGKLVLVDAGGKIPEDTAQAIAASLARLGTVYPSMDAYLAAMRQVPMWQWNAFWEQYFRYDAQVHADGGVTSRVPRSAIEEETAALGATRTEALPAFVHTATLIVRAALGTLGAERGVILPREEAERLRGLIGGSRVVEVPQTNHYTIILSDIFLDTVAAFLAEED